MTDELQGNGSDSYITEFVSGGPKNYAYLVRSSKDDKIHPIIKIRGFTLDHISAKKLNFQTLKEKVQAFVRSGAKEKVTVVRKKIERLKDRTVVTRWVKKDYQVVYDKHQVLPDYSTLPYGY